MSILLFIKFSLICNIREFKLKTLRAYRFSDQSSSFVNRIDHLNADTSKKGKKNLMNILQHV